MTAPSINSSYVCLLCCAVLCCATQVLIVHTALVDEEMAKLKSKVRRVCHLNAAGTGDEGEVEVEVECNKIPDSESASVCSIFVPILEALTVRLMATRQVSLCCTDTTHCTHT